MKNISFVMITKLPPYLSCCRRLLTDAAIDVEFQPGGHRGRAVTRYHGNVSQRAERPQRLPAEAKRTNAGQVSKLAQFGRVVLQACSSERD